MTDLGLYVRVSTIMAMCYVGGRSQIKVHTNERTQVHSAQSSLGPPIQVLTGLDAERYLTSVTDWPNEQFHRRSTVVEWLTQSPALL